MGCRSYVALFVSSVLVGCSADSPAQVTVPPVTPSASTATAATQVPSLRTRRRGIEWPGFLGPQRNSVSPETGLITPWPEDGPKIVWQRKLGTGYAIGSIDAGRLFQFDRHDDEAVLDCLNAETGKELWSFKYPTDYVDTYGYNGGPRAAPLIDGDRVYLYGVEGMLHCLDVRDGRVLWKVDTVKEFGVVQNFFGVGSVPIVDEDLLLVMVGGSPPEDQDRLPSELDRVDGNGTGVVAFHKRTGKVVYETSNELASYSSLQTATIDDVRFGLAFCRGGLLAFEPQTGKVRFHYPWRSPKLESVNASTPVIVNNEVFISETYGPGSTLLKVDAKGYDVVWKDREKSRDKAMQCHWNTPIYHDGYLYGCSGRNPPDADLRCIEWSTGKVQWTVPNRIRTSLLFVDGHFICLGEYGALQLFRANPKKFELVSEVTLPGEATSALFGPQPLLKYPCWSAPVLSHGLLYVRGDDRLVCLEVIPDTR